MASLAKSKYFIGVITCIAILAGFYERFYVATHPIGTLTSDGATIGLMAFGIVHHHSVTAYMWGQAYGGSLEPIFDSLIFLIVGSGTHQLIFATIIASFLATCTLLFFALQIMNRSAAWFGAILFWLWPASLIWRSTKPGGTYWIGLAVCLTASGLFVKLTKDKSGFKLSLACGLFVGLAIWSTPMSLQIFIPLCLFEIRQILKLAKTILGILSGFFIGLSPAIYFGVLHKWSNFQPPGGGGKAFSGFLSRFIQFFSDELPLEMSLRIQRSLSWNFFDVGLYLILGAFLIFCIFRSLKEGDSTPAAITVIFLPFIYSANHLADNLGQARYAMFGFSMVPLLFSFGIFEILSLHNRKKLPEKPKSANRSTYELAVLCSIAILATALALTALADAPSNLIVGFPAPDVPMPTNDTQLVTALEKYHIHTAYATYWMAYRVTFETNESTLVTPYYFIRSPQIAMQVLDSKKPAYLFVSTSHTLSNFRSWLTSHSVKYSEISLNKFSIVIPAQNIKPSRLGKLVTGLRSKFPPKYSLQWLYQHLF